MLGTINPVKEIITKAHSKNIPVLIDGAWHVHIQVDVQELDADFYVFRDTKSMSTGIRVLLAKEWLEKYHLSGGGEMIQNVTFERTTYNELPFKFEANT